MSNRVLVLGCALAAATAFAACGGKTVAEPETAVGGTAGSAAKGGAGGNGGTSGNGGSAGPAGSGGAAASAGVAGKGGSGGLGGSGGVAGSAGEPAWSACQEPVDCTLVSLDCCHMDCGEASLGNFAAINNNFANDYVAKLCTPPPPCPGYVCPEEQAKEFLRTSAQFGVTCENHVCKSFDVRTNVLSQCDSSNDCRLRWGLGCCEGCSGGLESIVAVSKNGPLDMMLCGNVDVDCCNPPPFPTDAIAMCLDAHCAVVWAL